jgi:hypothetical protein
LEEKKMNIIKTIKTVAAGALMYAAATFGSGCAVIPMYDFGAKRELFRLENKAKINEKVTVCGRVELRGNEDDQVDIESLVARGIIVYDLGNGWHLVANYIAKPGEDIQLAGAGYGGKIGDNIAWHLQLKHPTGDEGSLEVELQAVVDSNKGALLLRPRFYPETERMNIETLLRGKLGKEGKSGPVIGYTIVGESGELEGAVIAGYKVKFTF